MAKKKQVSPSLYPYKMSGFMGKNNVTPTEKCKPNEFQTMTNVDITDTGQIVKRQGDNLLYSGSVHSLFANGINGNATCMLFREGTALKSFDTSTNGATTLRSGITRTNWMRYLALNNLVYYTDEFITGITDGTTSRSWGLEVPPNQLVLTQTTGLLPTGRYLCSLTYVRNDGQESGAPLASWIDITSDNAGIAISNIPTSSDTTVSYVYIYLSTRNGEVLYKAVSVNNGTTTATYAGHTQEFSQKLTTLQLGPPPAGHIVQYYNGRIYIAKDSAVWYTQPYNYELVDLAHGFLFFPNRVTLFAPVMGGIWVSYKDGKTFFLEGSDPEKGFVTNWKKDSSVHEGSQQPTEVTIRGEVMRGWIWTADDGIYLGLDGGHLINKTENRYEPGSATIAVSFNKKTRDGSNQYVSVLY